MPTGRLSEDVAIRFPEQAILSVPHFLRRVARDLAALDSLPDPPGPVWYRGIRHSAGTLDTTWARSGLSLDREANLLKRFQQNAGNYVNPTPASDDEWAWMFLMRHYGAPSRLLDWTESALIGLYFAVEAPPAGRDADEDDATVWALLPMLLNQKANIETPRGTDVPTYGTDNRSGLDNYQVQRVGREQAHTVPPAAGFAPRNSLRMEAQQGAFTIHHADQKALDEWHDGEHVWRYVVPGARKAAIRRDLRIAGINRLALFRDLDSVAWVAEESIRA